MDSEHWSLDRLVGLARGLLADDERLRAETHIGACERCAVDARWARAVLESVTQGMLPAPPEEAVRRAYAIFPTRPTQLESQGAFQRIRHLVAALVRDSALEPLPAGVRGGAPVPRHLLFEIENADVDLKLMPGDSGRSLSLYGQVAPREPGVEVVSLDVRLVPETGPNRRTSTDEFGEFLFEDLAPGAFAVVVDFAAAFHTLGPIQPVV